MRAPRIFTIRTADHNEFQLPNPKGKNGTPITIPSKLYPEILALNQELMPPQAKSYQVELIKTYEHFGDGYLSGRIVQIRSWLRILTYDFKIENDNPRILPFMKYKQRALDKAFFWTFQNYSALNLGHNSLWELVTLQILNHLKQRDGKSGYYKLWNKECQEAAAVDILINYVPWARKVLAGLKLIEPETEDEIYQVPKFYDNTLEALKIYLNDENNSTLH